MINNIKNKLFEFVWQKWLYDFKGEKIKVVKVKGWRTALIEESSGNRKTITPMFKWEET